MIEVIDLDGSRGSVVRDNMHGIAVASLCGLQWPAIMIEIIDLDGSHRSAEFGHGRRDPSWSLVVTAIFSDSAKRVKGVEFAFAQQTCFLPF
jgi:hypothetical protein